MNTTNDTKTNEMSFRSADDVDRLKRAEKVCAKHDELVAGATSALASAEAECAEDPSDANVKKAKEARRALEDAEQGRSLARQHQGKVAAEVAAAERARIEEKIARGKLDLTEVVDDEALMMTVDLVVRALELQQRTEARAAQHLAGIKHLNALSALVGAAAERVPTVDDVINAAVVRMAEIGLSAQAQSGVRESTSYRFFPFWRGYGVIQEHLTGKERFSICGATGDGTPITMGKDRTPLVNEAKALLERVKAKSAALRVLADPAASGDAAKRAIDILRGDRPIIGSTLALVARVATSAAPVLALATAAALTLSQG